MAEKVIINSLTQKLILHIEQLELERERKQEAALKEIEEENWKIRHKEYKKREIKEFIKSMDKKDRINFLKEFK